MVEILQAFAETLRVEYDIYVYEIPERLLVPIDNDDVLYLNIESGFLRIGRVVVSDGYHRTVWVNDFELADPAQLELAIKVIQRNACCL